MEKDIQCGQLPDDIQRQPTEEERTPPPHPDERVCKDGVALLPNQKHADRRHKDAMTIVLVIDPASSHKAQTVVIGQSKQRAYEGDMENKPIGPAR